MNKKIITQYLSVLWIAAVCILLSSLPVKAEYVEDKINHISYEDEITINVRYSSHYYDGGGGYTYIRIPLGYSITNIKSSSSNLKAKKTGVYFYTGSFTTWDSTTQEYVSSKGTQYGDTYISYYAKKPGKYKVKFDVIDKNDKFLYTKSITIIATGTSDTSDEPVKSIKYAGKDLWQHEPYTTTTKGKLEIKMNKNYKLVSVNVGKTNSTGKLVYKKVNNNKNITLAKTGKFVSKDRYGDEDRYDPMFPETSIRITYKNIKTKEVGTVVYSLRTFKPDYN